MNRPIGKWWWAIVGAALFLAPGGMGRAAAPGRGTPGPTAAVPTVTAVPTATPLPGPIWQMTTAFPRPVPSGQAAAMARLADGRVVVAGNTWFGTLLARYLPDGRLDPTLDPSTEAPIGGAFPLAVAVQVDGKVVVAAQLDEGRYGAWLVARFLPDGRLDPGFGTGGMVVQGGDAYLFATASALAIDPAGNIVVGGEMVPVCPYPGCVPDGSTPTWILNRLLPNGSPDPAFHPDPVPFTPAPFAPPGGLVLQPDGKIVLAGPTAGLTLYRALPDGRTDSTFGQGGVVTGTLGLTASNTTPVLAAGGAILVAGTAPGGPDERRLAIGRLRPDGTPDTTFGSGGLARGPTVTDPAGLAVQPDGAILAAATAPNPTGSDFLVARFRPDGSLDPAFGAGGSARAGFAGTATVAGLALGPDGLITLAGSTAPGGTGEGDLALARFDAAGSLDPSFGSGGRVDTVLTESDAGGAALVRQPDGKLVAAGGALLAGDRSAVALARYLPDGSADPAFGTGGRVQSDFGGSGAEAAAFALQADDKLVVAGTWTTSAQCGEPFIARYRPDGQLDPAFGAGGWVTLSVTGTCSYARAVAVQADGKIVVVGYSNGPEQPFGFYFWRLLADGRLDPAFGSGGVVEPPDNRCCAGPEAVAIAPDGTIVAAGRAGLGSDRVMEVVRLLPDGRRDPRFGTNGSVETAGSGGATTLVLQPDRKIVIGSTTATGFLLVRYLPGGMLDPGFGAGGIVTTPAASPGVHLALVRQDDGRLVVAAEDGVLARYGADGALDPSFGADGLIQVFLGDAGPANALVALPGGGVAVAGASAWRTVGARRPRLFAVATVGRDGCAAGQFRDVSLAAYFYGAVHYLAARGVLSGYGDCTFRPYANTTRGQMVKIAVLGFGVPAWAPPAGEHTFGDVPAGSPFFAVVEAAAHANMVSGYTCGGPGEPCDAQARPYFRPGAAVTRGQLAKLGAGAAGWPIIDPPGPSSFADVPPGSAFYPFVETALCHGVVSGYACGGPGEPCDAQARPYYRPGTLAVRGQVAKLVYGAVTGHGSCVPPRPTATPTMTPLPSPSQATSVTTGAPAPASRSSTPIVRGK